MRFYYYCGLFGSKGTRDVAQNINKSLSWASLVKYLLQMISSHVFRAPQHENKDSPLSIHWFGFVHRVSTHLIGLFELGEWWDCAWEDYVPLGFPSTPNLITLEAWAHHISRQCHVLPHSNNSPSHPPDKLGSPRMPLPRAKILDWSKE